MLRRAVLGCLLLATPGCQLITAIDHGHGAAGSGGAPDHERGPDGGAAPGDGGPPIGDGASGYTFDWLHQLGVDHDLTGTAALLPFDGEPVFAGYFSGAVGFAGGPTRTSSYVDGYVVKLHEDGTHKWTYTFGGDGIDTVYALAEAADGAVVAAGELQEQVDFQDGQPPLVSRGSYDPCVIKLDAQGRLVWRLSFGSVGLDSVRGLAIDAMGDIILAGSFQGTMTVGNTVEAMGVERAFVAKLDRDGNPVWVRAYGSAASSQAFSVVAVGTKLYVTGRVDGDADFGDGRIESGGSGFLLELDQLGQPGWRFRFGQENRTAEGRSLVIRNQDELYLGGRFAGEMQVGPDGTRIFALDGDDGFAARLSLAGVALWTLPIRGIGNEAVTGVSGASDRMVSITGFFDGNLQLPDGNYASHGGRDFFVGRVEAATGAFADGIALGGAKDEAGFGTNEGMAAVAGRDHRTYFTTTFQGSFQIGDRMFRTGQQDNAYIPTGTVVGRIDTP